MRKSFYPGPEITARALFYQAGVMSAHGHKGQAHVLLNRGLKRGTSEDSYYFERGYCQGLKMLALKEKA